MADVRAPVVRSGHTGPPGWALLYDSLSLSESGPGRSLQSLPRESARADVPPGAATMRLSACFGGVSYVASATRDPWRPLAHPRLFFSDRSEAGIVMMGRCKCVENRGQYHVEYVSGCKAEGAFCALTMGLLTEPPPDPLTASPEPSRTGLWSP